MDSQYSSAAPPPPSLPPHSHHPSQPPFHYQPQAIPMGPPQSHANSFSVPTSNTIMSPHHQQQQQQNQGRFPFNPMVSSGGPQKVEFSDGNGGGDSSSPQTNGAAAGFSVDAGKKKRGRPRKYSPDGQGQGNNIALGLSPSPVTPGSSAAVTGSGGGGGTLSSENQVKKHRGRPPGSGKKQLDALGVAGVGFTPHVITVKAGEDIASKIVAFTQQGPRTVCVLSANGAISNVTLRQPATSGGTVTYEGRFEIISLSGSFLLSENNGSRSRTGGLSVSLAGSDGRVLGGGVAGMLVAATPVQVVLGSFIQDGKKPKSAPSPVSAATTAPNMSPTPAPASNMLSFGNQGTGASPPSQVASSYSSDDNGSPVNQGPYANASQPMQNVPMYGNMSWGNTSMKMHPN